MKNKIFNKLIIWISILFIWFSSVSADWELNSWNNINPLDWSDELIVCTLNTEYIWYPTVGTPLNLLWWVSTIEELDSICWPNPVQTADEIFVDSMDTVAIGWLSVFGALMWSTFWQILIFVFGILLLILVVGAIFFVYSLVSKKK